MTFQILFVILIALSIGSFTNVCIYRLPFQQNIYTSSSCTECKKKIKYFDNIPLFSFLLLRGKCRYCKKKISYQYPIVELTVCLIALLFYFKYNFSIIGVLTFLFFISLLIIIFTDFQHFIIPNEITYSFIILGILISLFDYSILNLSIFDSLIGGIISGLILFISSKIFFYIKKIEGMGLGDIKMISMIGFWLGLPNTIVIIILSAFLGSIFGLFLILIKKMNRHDHIPYGSFIGLTAMLISLINIYLEFDINYLLNKY